VGSLNLSNPAADGKVYQLFMTLTAIPAFIDLWDDGTGLIKKISVNSRDCPNAAGKGPRA